MATMTLVQKAVVGALIAVGYEPQKDGPERLVPDTKHGNIWLYNTLNGRIKGDPHDFGFCCVVTPSGMMEEWPRELSPLQMLLNLCPPRRDRSFWKEATLSDSVPKDFALALVALTLRYTIKPLGGHEIDFFVNELNDDATDVMVDLTATTPGDGISQILIDYPELA